jgi:hypothetical protein
MTGVSPWQDWRKKPRKKRSAIWRMPSDEFRELMARSESLSAILRHFGLEHKGHNHHTLKARLAAEGIDFGHIDPRPEAVMVRFNRRAVPPLEAVLVENSSYGRHHLKRRLLQSGILKSECAVCGLGPVWMGQPLVMVLDHINGVANDNRLENLRMLCPNCNSQTATYCARNYSKGSHVLSGVG